MKKFIFYLFAILLISCTNSTRYSGYVYDENQKAISNVKVQIVGSDIVTYTNSDGFFQLDHKNRGNELLVIKEGYMMQFYTPESPSEDIELVLIKESE